MRVSTSTITNMATNSMGNTYKTYVDIMNKIATNKNFNKVSENVVDATKVLKLNDQLAQMDIYQSNIQAAINEMDLAYDTLGAVTDEVSTINGLIVQASNATNSPESAKAIAMEIKQRVATIQDKMNVQYLDNYVFSGTYTKEQPYVVDGNGDIKYQGSSQKAGERNLTISENTTFTYNFTGEEIFGKQDPTLVDDDGVQLDFFSQMKHLDELLNADTLDYDKIREKLGVLDSVTKNITQSQGMVSAKVSKLDATRSINEDTILKLTEDKVDLEEVDIVKAATDLANAQTALQASYSIGTTILGSVSLLDYL
jgi:flagellin-like hook-associated protein FlgL